MGVRVEVVRGAGQAVALAELQLRTALVAYQGIFPPEAPEPTVESLTARWLEWLAPHRPAGQEAFVALDGTALVGTALAGPDPADVAVGHLSRLYVAPERWGQGIGRALHDACLGHLAGLGHPEATLWVLEPNTRARRWYEAIGWRGTGARQAVFPPSGLDEVGYRLEL